MSDTHTEEPKIPDDVQIDSSVTEIDDDVDQDQEKILAKDTTDEEDKPLQNKKRLSRNGEGKLHTILLAAFLSTILTLLLVHFLAIRPMKERIVELEFQADLRPPVLLMDLVGFAESIKAGEDYQERANQEMVRFKNKVQELADKGFLIIDSNAVMGAPNKLYFEFSSGSATK